jgi:Zn finger protein HypA/HybF involved in hydrogenase expression
MNNTIKHLPNGDFEVLYEAGEMHSDKGYKESTHEKQAEFAKKRCWCHTCRPIDYRDPSSVYMRLCPDCGNKRCPKATNHTLECTGSNDSGQTGSIY